jgi:hypothetical protein
MRVEDRHGSSSLGSCPRLRAILAAFTMFALLLCLPKDGDAEQPASNQGAPQQNAFLAQRPFLQIPGPNPILTTGPKGSWDESMIEQAGVFEDAGTYYLYYHGAPVDHAKWGAGGYRIGLATASDPLGPWKKYGNNPVVNVGPAGSWDDFHVACATIMREAPGKYYMWYCGKKKEKFSRPYGNYSIGLATASTPTGPWKKYELNPLLPFFGYVSGVVKAKGKYYLYSEHPIGVRADDYGPVSVATAARPEGPWTVWKGNPALPLDEVGTWDDAGYSDAGATYWGGTFHMFFSGAKEYRPRILSQESVGYASSADGLHFTQYGGNPVAAREANPNAAAFGEVHALFKPPFIYLYHTLRYLKAENAPFADQRPSVLEDLGVQVLVTQRPFRLSMPVVALDDLPGGVTTELGNCPPIGLQNVTHVSLTAESTFSAGAQAGMRVRVFTSYDGLAYDTLAVTTFDNDLKPGAVGRKTIELDTHAKFLKVRVENLDQHDRLSNIRITVTLGG